MSDELSDEAFWEWTKQAFGEDVRQMGNRNSRYTVIPACLGFSTAREWRCRAEALIETNKSLHQESVAKWMTEEGFTTGHGDSIGALLEELSWQMKERIDTERRKAFETGWLMRGSGVHSVCPAAYRAYTKAAKENK